MKNRYFIITGILLLLLSMGAITGITLSSDQNKHKTIKNDAVEDTSQAFSHPHYTVETYHPAECIHAAYSTYYCATCDKNYVVTREPALGHAYDEGTVLEINSCDQDGSIEYTCERCGEKSVEVLSKSHTYTYNISKEATCIEEGIANGATCSACGYHTDEVISLPKKGHDYIYECYSKSNPHKLYYKKCTRCHDLAYDDLDVDYTKLYGYITLSQYERGSRYCSLYQSLFEEALEIQSSKEDRNTIYVYHDLYDLTNREIGAVYSQFVRDNPQFYFLDTYSITSSYIVISIPSAYRKYSSRSLYKAKLDVIINHAIANLKGDTEADTISNIHNYIRDTVAYDSSESKESHTMLGALINQKAVCDGYGKAFQYLCYILGINAIGVSGTSYEGTSKAGYHYWNYVECDGKWYGIDITWDDIEDYYFMWWNLNGKRKEMYLMAKSTLMLENHKAGTSLMEEYQSSDTSTVSYKNRFSVMLPILEE